MYGHFGKRSAGSHSGISPIVRSLSRHPWILASVSSALLLGMVTASAIVSHDDTPVQVHTILEQLAAPTLTAVDTGTGGFVREERIQRSDTIASLLTRLGVNDTAALAFINQDANARAIARQLRPGQTVTAASAQDGSLSALYFPGNSKDSLLVIERRGDDFSSREVALELSTQIHVQSGTITSSLFGATDAADIPDAIATQLAEIFSGDIDFYRDLRKGDHFSLVYESLHHKGKYLRSGRILAAEFVNDGNTYQAYWFEGTADGSRNGGYYTVDGKSLRRAFLRSPLEFSRVTSGFSNARKHPILQYVRAHKGIDYGAPTGTPVRAVADGTVEFAGRQNGYGNLLVIRHQGKYSTAYGHLNGFAKGIRKGSRVSQGDHVAFVGQTGMATGPHLHYEFRVNGTQINPTAIAIPASIPLNAAHLKQFKNVAASLRSQLDLVKNAASITQVASSN